MTQSKTQRAQRLVEPADVTAHIRDGMTIGIGGFINSGHPMVLVRQLIADGRRDLRVVGAASAGLEVDLLVAAGVASRVVTPYVGAEGLAGIGPAFRKAAQDGLIEVFEIDEAQFYAGLRAAAQRLPFNPWRAGVGTDYPIVNPSLKEFEDPISGQKLLAVPAIELDVCLLHAAIGDAYGNVQHNGTHYGDTALAAAADLTFVSVETIVSNEQIRANPAATTIAGADGVVRAQYGAHPFSSEGYYRPDEQHLKDYLAAATATLRTGSRTALEDYVTRYILGPKDHAAYLEQVGIRRLLSLHEF